MASRRLGEADEDYVRRLDGVRRYKLKRPLRDEFRYSTGNNGQVSTGTMWTVYDGGGQWVSPADLAGKTGRTDFADKLRRRSRTGKIVYWSTIAGGTAMMVSSLALTGSDNDGLWIGTLGGGAALALGGAWTGFLIHGRTTRHQSYWTVDEVDTLIDEANSTLAEELGLSERDRLDADVTDD